MPSKVSAPGTRGIRASLNGPAAQTSTSAVRSPRLVRSRHRVAASSQRASATSTPNRMCRTTS
ncbi:hypothetical protein [Nocardia barduliensis]|uniref:hypothetical protein n=1 Tax=Nocardia barduliensis TaxID=2736643 RepID=UPI0015743632|nr:hypothetical protein [Nocardia barduliensis]